MPQRVLLWQVSHILGDLLDVLFAIEPAEVVGEIGAGESVSARVAETDADVLIASQKVLGDAVVALKLLRQHPSLRVVVLVSEGRQALLYELLPVIHDLNGISVPALVRVVRGRP